MIKFFKELANPDKTEFDAKHRSVKSSVERNEAGTITQIVLRNARWPNELYGTQWTFVNDTFTINQVTKKGLQTDTFTFSELRR
ncbi:MAG: hypothetical protein FWG67_00070, partial [Defluviitaleaceae bacterium]|nr:hypothetical protein [Defluviitaleaceae bacterium]